MNNVSELYSLIHFLRIRPVSRNFFSAPNLESCDMSLEFSSEHVQSLDPLQIGDTDGSIVNQYCEPENFRRDFTTPLKSSSESAKSRAMRKLQALLKAILLRRTKKSQIDGKSILDLPERTTEQSHAVFSDDELAFYQALETHTQLTFNKYLKANTVGRNYSNILVLLLRLRQAVSTLSDFIFPFPTHVRVLKHPLSSHTCVFAPQLCVMYRNNRPRRETLTSQ